MNSMKTAVAALAAMLLLASCTKDDAPKRADNTAINARDKAPEAVTPLDQGNGTADLDVTQQIRKQLIADESLSGDAKNAKIITSSGVITLRGPVASAEERNRVVAAATKFAGSNRVDDQLEVLNSPRDTTETK